MTTEILNLTLSQAHLGILEYLPYTGNVNYTSEPRTQKPEHFSTTLKLQLVTLTHHHGIKFHDAAICSVDSVTVWVFGTN